MVEGELELLALEPTDRAASPWWSWEAADGRRAVRGGPGTLMHVPARTPHAFRNIGDEWVTMLFQSAPSGHEDYFVVLAALLAASDGRPDPVELALLRARFDIQQLSVLRAG